MRSLAKLIVFCCLQAVVLSPTSLGAFELTSTQAWATDSGEIRERDGAIQKSAQVLSMLSSTAPLISSDET